MPQFVQETVVRFEGFGKARIEIGQAKLLGGRFHDSGKRRVVGAANIGKEVVLYLLIQPASEESGQFAIRSKIGGGVELVYRPVVVDQAGFVGVGERGFFHHCANMKITAKNMPATKCINKNPSRICHQASGITIIGMIRKML